jgi:hypothetical protein
MALACVFLLCEALGRLLDPRDLVAESLRWTLRGWRPALLAACAYGLVLAIGAGLIVLLPIDKNTESLAPELMTIALWFFVWNAEFVRAPRPQVSGMRPRWPGRVAVLLPLAVLLAATAWSAMNAGTPTSAWPWALMAPLLAINFLIDIAVRWLWLNRKNSLREAFAVALRPAVFLPALMLELSWWIACVLLLLVVVPVCYLFIDLLPGLEQSMESVQGTSVMLLVHWSRVAVSWWWAIAVAGLGSLLMAWKLWFGPVACGRLMFELGLVREDAD